MAVHHSNASSASPGTGHGERRHTLDDRLDGIGWGLFLAMLGVLWLVPDEQVPHGAWLVGTGLILLGLNAYRFAEGVAPRLLTTVLGLAALVAGIGRFAAIEIPVLPLGLIVVGIGLVVEPWVAARR
jgi:hypothetical protein